MADAVVTVTASLYGGKQRAAYLGQAITINNGSTKGVIHVLHGVSDLSAPDKPVARLASRAGAHPSFPITAICASYNASMALFYVEVPADPGANFGAGTWDLIIERKHSIGR